MKLLFTVGYLEIMLSFAVVENKRLFFVVVEIRQLFDSVAIICTIGNYLLFTEMCLVYASSHFLLPLSALRRSSSLTRLSRWPWGCSGSLRACSSPQLRSSTGWSQSKTHRRRYSHTDTQACRHIHACINTYIQYPPHIHLHSHKLTCILPLPFSSCPSLTPCPSLLMTGSMLTSTS